MSGEKGQLAVHTLPQVLPCGITLARHSKSKLTGPWMIGLAD